MDKILRSSFGEKLREHMPIQPRFRKVARALWCKLDALKENDNEVTMCHSVKAWSAIFLCLFNGLAREVQKLRKKKNETKSSHGDYATKNLLLIAFLYFFLFLWLSWCDMSKIRWLVTQIFASQISLWNNSIEKFRHSAIFTVYCWSIDEYILKSTSCVLVFVLPIRVLENRGLLISGFS